METERCKECRRTVEEEGGGRHKEEAKVRDGEEEVKKIYGKEN